MQFTIAEPTLPKTGAIAFLVPEGGRSPLFGRLDQRAKGALGRALRAANFTGKVGDYVEFLSPAGSSLDAVTVLGAGSTFADVDAEKAGGRLMGRLMSRRFKTVTVFFDAVKGDGAGAPDRAAHILLGALLRSYRFDLYRTKEKPESRPVLSKLVVATPNPGKARNAFAPLKAVAGGVFFARDLVTEPPNVLYPGEFASRTKSLEELGVKVEILNKKRLEKMGMNALLAVGQGSARESYVVTMEWHGGGPKQKPLAFVGKGVTFDTGGISIKPAANMHEMKYDMGGAAAVTGAMRALAARKARVNAVGLIGLVENMPSGTAQRPGDVVKSYSGQTIEVLNTDAEGRLVLADVLWYAQERYKPQLVVDLATLTGAILISLGREYAGVFSNNDELCDRLRQAGDEVDEKVWRLPMGPGFDEFLKSDIADMKNIGGPFGGSITAAQFLKRFMGEIPWVHIDVAGVAWTDKDKPVVPKGASGYGVRLLDRLVADCYENDRKR